MESRPLLLKELAAKKTAKKKEPFHLSNRYFRGRIIDTLRSAPRGKTEKELHTVLMKLNVPELKRLPVILSSLLAEGLIKEQSGIYRL